MLHGPRLLRGIETKIGVCGLMGKVWAADYDVCLVGGIDYEVSDVFSRSRSDGRGGTAGGGAVAAAAAAAAAVAVGVSVLDAAAGGGGGRRPVPPNGRASATVASVRRTHSRRQRPSASGGAAASPRGLDAQRGAPRAMVDASTFSGRASVPAAERGVRASRASLAPADIGAATSTFANQSVRPLPPSPAPAPSPRRPLQKAPIGARRVTRRRVVAPHLCSPTLRAVIPPPPPPAHIESRATPAANDAALSPVRRGRLWRPPHRPHRRARRHARRRPLRPVPPRRRRRPPHRLRSAVGHIMGAVARRRRAAWHPLCVHARRVQGRRRRVGPQRRGGGGAQPHAPHRDDGAAVWGRGRVGRGGSGGDGHRRRRAGAVVGVGVSGWVARGGGVWAVGGRRPRVRAGGGGAGGGRGVLLAEGRCGAGGEPDGERARFGGLRRGRGVTRHVGGRGPGGGGRGGRMAMIRVERMMWPGKRRRPQEPCAAAHRGRGGSASSGCRAVFRGAHVYTAASLAVWRPAWCRVLWPTESRRRLLRGSSNGGGGGGYRPSQVAPTELWSGAMYCNKTGRSGKRNLFRKNEKKIDRVAPGFEPGTSSTQRKNRTTRPCNLRVLH
ncbi:hypothetical protein BU14_0889s0006 [Porphyra umbilicalis]|uniref:Uncharacterized protein n=1 Tax=Porphyra umbilicalis TaxID=2786 RepID=A0A1X6NNH6_PORUM|nr:hypothetical protein BU14_0889s0006 [Porphyra umbilicalis]|eukprot:OSX70135.1 hypothetical protein BU14_0889s0006 [Porphyra umbilicalis]